MNVGDQHQQARHLLASLEDAKLATELDRARVVWRPARDTDDLGLGGLRLKDEGREVRRGEWRPNGADHLAAVRINHRTRVALQRMAERIVVRDEEPAVATSLYDLLRG